MDDFHSTVLGFLDLVKMSSAIGLAQPVLLGKWINRGLFAESELEGP